MKVMYAVAFHEHGDASVLKHQRLPLPSLQPNDVAIDVKAVAVNRRDVWSREGVVGVAHPLPHIPGSDVVGVIHQVGATVTNVKVGDEVIVHTGISCRNCQMCTSGQESSCSSFQIYGFDSKSGGYAEMVCVPAVNLIPKPKELSWEEAAGLAMSLTAAWHMLVEQIDLRPGEKLLILGANTSIGTAAIQLAKNVLHADVFAAVHNEEQAKKAKELGASHVIDLSKEDPANVIRFSTKKSGVDAVLGYIDEADLDKSLRSLKVGGRVILNGAPNGAHAKVNLRYLFSKQLSLIGSRHGGKDSLLKAMKFVAQGKIKPVLGQVMSLKEAAQAHEKMESGDYFGALVLKP